MMTAKEIDVLSSLVAALEWDYPFTDDDCWQCQAYAEGKALLEKAREERKRDAA